jgi:enolase-phosphatase E1
MKALILDIEGTTTSISFVYDVLFPFARRELPRFIAAHWGEDEVMRGVNLMAPEAQTPEAAAAAAMGLMDRDVKDTGLKVLQGLVWDDGYRSGELRGHVYADVPVAMAAAKARGLELAIYSSGSVAAQKLIFGFSEAGDLSVHISRWFDTTTGPKKEATSYVAIAAALGLPASECTFATDNLDEARAARAAGMNAVVAIRPGNADLPEDHGFATFVSLFNVL